MAAATALFPAPVLEVVWLPPAADAAAADAPETALALLADGQLAVVSALRGSEWEEAGEELADEDDESDAVFLEGRVVQGLEGDGFTCGRQGQLRHLVWLSPG
jgi:hypothetical protein